MINAILTSDRTRDLTREDEYLKIGANPRDNVNDTEANRGYGVQKTIELLRDAEFEIA